MHDTLTYGLLVLCASGAGLLAIQSHALAQWLRIPAPALFLAAAAVSAEVIPDSPDPTHQTVERSVTLALIVILFDGGLHIGARRMRTAAPSVLRPPHGACAPCPSALNTRLGEAGQVVQVLPHQPVHDGVGEELDAWLEPVGLVVHGVHRAEVLHG